MADSDRSPGQTARPFPRVPAYAWSWLQRSRPVLTEVAGRLTGGSAPAGFIDDLRERFEEDPFTRDVVVGAVADIAFNGRIPRHRPRGVSWDRGLTWWAAAIAGVTPAQFEAAPQPVVQSRLFGVEEQHDQRPARRTARARAPAASSVATGERAALVGALRDLLRTAEDDRIPAGAIRDLLAQLQGPHSAEGTQRQ